MFHFFSKLLTLFLMPFFWLFVFIAMAYFSKSDKRRNWAIKVAFFILFIFGNSYLASRIMSWWEPKPIEMSKLQNHEVVVVLGGGIANELKWPYDRGHFDPSADRLLQAFQLYKAGKIHKILVSAGTSSANKSRTEASISREFLISTGVPESDILIDIQSKNTFENALFSKTILKANRLEYSKILLITSAYHMKRSVACFEKNGLKVTAFPAAYQKLNNRLLSFYTIVPDEDAFVLWYNLMHEWMGIVSYKLMGYI